MRILFYLLLTSFFLLGSCGDDDECDRSNWIGTYTGTESCDAGDPVSKVVTISEGSTDNLIIINGEEVPFTVTCTASTITEDPIFNIDIITNYSLDGSTLKSTQTYTAQGVTLTCIFEGSR